MEVYNLIIELEVDLDHELTLGELQKRLEEQVKKWSSITHESLNPPEKVKAQANLNNTEHYKTILNDRARVKAEYEEARDSVKKKKGGSRTGNQTSYRHVLERHRQRRKP